VVFLKYQSSPRIPPSRGKSSLMCFLWSLLGDLRSFLQKFSIPYKSPLVLQAGGSNCFPIFPTNSVTHTVVRPLPPPPPTPSASASILGLGGFQLKNKKNNTNKEKPKTNNPPPKTNTNQPPPQVSVVFLNFLIFSYVSNHSSLLETCLVVEYCIFSNFFTKFLSILPA